MSEKKEIMPNFPVLGPTKAKNVIKAVFIDNNSENHEIIPVRETSSETDNQKDEQDSISLPNSEKERQVLIKEDPDTINRYIYSYAVSEGRQASHDENRIVNETTRFHDGKIQLAQSKANGKTDYLDIATIWNFLGISIKQSLRTSEQILILSFYNNRRAIIKREQLNRRNVLDYIDQLGLCTNESMSKSKLGSAFLDHIKQRLKYADIDLAPDYIGFYKGIDGRWLYCSDKRNTWHWLLQKSGTCEEISSLKQAEGHKPIITKPNLQKFIYLLFIYSAFVRVFHSVGIFLDKLIIFVCDDTCRKWITEIFHLYQDARSIIPLDCSSKQFKNCIDSMNASECVLVQAPSHYTSGQKVINNLNYLKQKATYILDDESGFFPIVLCDKITPISGVDTQECIYVPIERNDFIPSATDPFFEETYAIKPDSLRNMVEIFIKEQDHILEDLNQVLHSSTVDPDDIFQECVASMGAYFIVGDGFTPSSQQEKRRLANNFNWYKNSGCFDSPEAILLSYIRSYIENEGGRIKLSTTLKNYEEFKKTDLLYMTIEHEDYIGIQPSVYKRIVSQIRDNYPSSRILKALRARGCIKTSSGENRFITTLTFKDGTAASVAVYLFKCDCIYMVPSIDDEE